MLLTLLRVLIQPKCMGPSSSWALVPCTCCTIHCYATVEDTEKHNLHENKQISYRLISVST